tara:strand:+ start:93 stop:1406 length:1314 start_codon:yes stop_codon:yes gene_type:complete
MLYDRGCRSAEVFLKLNASLIKKTGAALVVRVLGAASSFILGVILARKLGADESGYYFIAFNLIVFLSAVFRCGFDDVILRIISVKVNAGRWEDAQSAALFSIFCVFLVSCAGALVVVSYSDFISVSVYSKEDLAPALSSIGLGLIGLSGLTLVSVVLQACGRVVFSIFTQNIFVNVVLAIIVFFFVNDSRHAGWVFSSVAIIGLFLGLLLFFYSIPKNKRFRASSFRVAATEILSPAMTLWSVLILSQFLLLVGQFFTGVFADSDDAAYYAAAQRSATLVGFVLMAVNLVVAPKFAGLHSHGDLDAISRLARDSVILAVLAATPLSLAMILYPQFFMGLFGAEFVQGGDILRILAIGQFISVMFGPVTYILLMSGGEKEMRRIVMIVVPISLVVGYVLTSRFGVMGAAYSSVLTLVFQGALTVKAVNRKYSFNVLR